MKRRLPTWIVPVLSVLGLWPGGAFGEEPIEYNRDIRPILSETCFRCHGPDSASRKADLRLDKRDAAVESKAIVPGDPDASELIARIFTHEADELMPPPAIKKELTEEQKQLLKRWVASGAEYQPHWSLVAPKKPEIPAVKNQAWSRNAVDRFILAKLEANGLAPAPEADRRTLARRLSLDLTGLPPEPAQVEAFATDTSLDYYEKYVDSLMKSSRWGEHRARYWLDAARYGDTHGIHIDNYRENWIYRNWVIGAFNRNLPFDRFTIEQLAGDLLPNATLDQRIASGFNRCNITTSEGGAIDEEYLVLYTRDRTETTSQVFLGLTAGCAVCHDHKFDPLSQKEFYAMAAFFNNTTQAAMDGNIKDTPPVVMVPKEEDRPRWDALGGLIAEAKKGAEDRKKAATADFDKWLAQTDPHAIEGTIPGDGLKLHARLSEGSGDALNLTVDGKPQTVALASAAWEPGYVGASAFKAQTRSLAEVAEPGDFDKGQPFSYGAWVKVPRPGMSGAIFARMDDQHDFRGWDLWIQDNRVGAHIIHRWPDDALKVVANKQQLKPNEWYHLFITYDGSGKAAGVSIYINGQLQEKTVEADALKSTIETKIPLKLAQRHTSSRLDDISLEDLRIYGKVLPAPDVDRLAKLTRISWLLGKAAAQRAEPEKAELYQYWLTGFDKPYAEANAKVAALEQEQATIKTKATVAHVMQEKADPAMAFVLHRGDYDKRRDKVTPGTPAALPAMPDDLPRNRLGFAQWLLRPENPLTTRVTVNRIWQEVFGAGIVRTAGDFGITGELPSHPELLDWMAVELRESGWDLKKFYKMLVTSATYRQAALTTPEKLAKDPANKLLSRGPRFRMDAEMVRDYALSTSGLLAEKLGGPSVKPYQPDGVWEAVAMIGSDTRDYRRDSGESLYRRSLYTFWKRSAPPASMDIFNAPSRESCTVRRERTNTPLQALVTLNDPQFVEAARNLAQRALKEGGAAPAGPVEYMARRLLSRSLKPEEKPIVDASLNDLLAHYKAHPDDAKALLTEGESKPDASLDPSLLAAWTMLANELMNLDEVLNK